LNVALPTSQSTSVARPIAVPVHEEKVELEKRPVVYEEVGVGRREVEETHQSRARSGAKKPLSSRMATSTRITIASGRRRSTTCGAPVYTGAPHRGTADMEVKDMSQLNRQQPYGAAADAETENIIELREEQLIAHKDLRELGEVEVRTEIEEIPGRLEVDAYREEVVVEHEAVGDVVSERVNPWEENGILIIPIYEEQLVVTKRLVCGSGCASIE